MICPSSLRLSQAFPNSASADLQAHLRTCPACAAQWNAMAQARAAVQELPYVTPDKGRREEVRKRLLAAAAGQPVARPPLARSVVWALVAAAGLCLLLGARLLVERTQGMRSASHFRAMVQSPGASRFVHERTGGDEWVRLSDGTLHIEVQPLQAGERFRVICSDSEVEVRGTAFETVVERDHLRSVSVLHGRVEVRPYGRPVTLLGAGEHWQAEATPGRERDGHGAAPTAASEAAEPAREPAVPAAVSPPTTPAPAPSAAVPKGIGSASTPPAHAAAAIANRRSAPAAASPAVPAGGIVHAPVARAAGADALPTPLAKPAISAAEQAFMDGWSALRQGRHQAAADSFARAAALSAGTPSASLLEDSRFWRAVSLARADQRKPAIAALREFLRQHPTAARAGEVTAILGWQLLRDGQIEEAQRCFVDAQKDAHPQIRENARSGLAAVAARR